MPDLPIIFCRYGDVVVMMIMMLHAKVTAPVMTKGFGSFAAVSMIMLSVPGPTNMGVAIGTIKKASYLIFSAFFFCWENYFQR